MSDQIYQALKDDKDSLISETFADIVVSLRVNSSEEKVRSVIRRGVSLAFLMMNRLDNLKVDRTFKLAMCVWNLKPMLKDLVDINEDIAEKLIARLIATDRLARSY